MREYAGRERALLVIAVATGRLAHEGAATEADNYRERAWVAWRELELRAQRDGVPPELYEQVVGVGRAYFEQFEALRPALHEPALMRGVDLMQFLARTDRMLVTAETAAHSAETEQRRATQACRAGIGAVSMAGNHMMDCGTVGLAETMAALDRNGIARAGAGMTLAEARRPAMIAAGARHVALLSYNCVGPELSWAGEDRPGCAYVHVLASDGGPSRPQADLVAIDPASLAAMQDDIAAARCVADLVIVALHKGITHRPAELAPYERPLAEAAVMAGADVVAGHHAHIARGIEVVAGKPVFHGLGNGVVVTRALSPAQDHPARAEWAERRKRLFGFEPDPAYPLAPFHPEATTAGRTTVCDRAARAAPLRHRYKCATRPSPCPDR